MGFLLVSCLVLPLSPATRPPPPGDSWACVSLGLQAQGTMGKGEGMMIRSGRWGEPQESGGSGILGREEDGRKSGGGG